MYRIFTYNEQFNKESLGAINSPLMNRIRELIQIHLDYQIKHYESYSSYINSDFILSRLAILLEPYLDDSLNTYNTVSDNLHNICNPLQITSSTTFGKIHHNSFYTNTCALISADFGLSSIKTDWEKITSVKVLTHPSLSMEVHIPVTVSRNKQLDGLAVIGIDIALFAYQLKKWTQYNKTKSDLEQESIADFISKYVLPNMIPSQIDCALRNRIEYLVRNEIPDVIEIERAFVKNYESAIKGPIEQILKNISTSRSVYRKAVGEIPFIFNDSYLSAVPFEIASFSTYSYWVVFMTFVDWVYPMVFFIPPSNINNTLISTILKRVDRFINGTGCLNHIPSELEDNVYYKYNKIKEKFFDYK